MKQLVFIATGLGEITAFDPRP